MVQTVLCDRRRRSTAVRTASWSFYQNNIGDCISKMLVGSRISERMKETGDL